MGRSLARTLEGPSLLEIAARSADDDVSRHPVKGENSNGHAKSPCGTRKTASCAGTGDLRSAEASFVRRPGDHRAKAPQVAREGRDRAPAVGHQRTLPGCVPLACGGKKPTCD